MRRATRLYRWVLGVLPSQHRERYGDEMAQMFEDEWNDRPRWERPALLARCLVGIVASAILLSLRGADGTGPHRLTGLSVGRGGWAGSKPRSGWIQDLLVDLRVGSRGLRRRPGQSVAVIVSLILGIGVNTAVFSLVNGLLLRPLPYAEAHQLLQLSETAPGIESMDVSLPDFDLWRGRTSVFSGMFAFDDASFLLTSPDRPEVLEGAVVSPGFLGVLGINPILGRGFSRSEERPGANGVAVISDALWDRRFARDPDVLGRALILNGSAREIIGVAPPAFHFPEVAHVWVPLAFDPALADPEDYGYDVIGRLAPGMNREAALAEGDAVAASLAALSPASKASIGVTAYPLRMADVPLAAGAGAVALLAAALLVMLVACTNVATLLLARVEDRKGEMAVRLALGAGAGRLTRQILAESGVLVVLGVAGALLVGSRVMQALPGLLPGEPPFWIRFDLDGRVFLWSALMGALCCMVIGLPAALQAARGGGLSAGSQRVLSSRARGTVVAIQVALATALVASAGLTGRALANLNQVDPGVDEENVLVIGAPLPPWSYPDHEARQAFYRDALERVRSLPGVVSAAAVDEVPFLSTGEEVALDGGGDPAAPRPVGLLSRFSDGYFSALGIPVVDGRLPDGNTLWEAGSRAVVSQSLARRLWPGQSAIGKRVRHGVAGTRSPTVDDDQPWFTVAAVVGDVLQSGPGRPTREALYVPMGTSTPRTFTMLVRTTGDPLLLADPVRERVHEVDPALPFYEPTTMALAREFSIWAQRTLSRLLAGFGTLAMVLSIVGVYGVMSHVTGRRRREMGLRLAIGASAREVRALVIRSSLRLLLPGLVVGLVLAGIVSVVFRAVLYEVGVLDPLTLAGTAAAFVGAGVLASYLPARRASRLDPVAALTAD